MSKSKNPQKARPRSQLAFLKSQLALEFWTCLPDNPEDYWREALGLGPNDGIEVHGSALDWKNSTEELMTVVSFRYDASGKPSSVVMVLDVYQNGTFSIGSSSCVSNKGAVAYLEAYARALKFIKAYVLTPRMY